MDLVSCKNFMEILRPDESMQTPLSDKCDHAEETRQSDDSECKSSQQATQEDKVTQFLKQEQVAIDEDVTSEYLQEIPASIATQMSVGKRLYSGCVCKRRSDVTVYLLDADMWQRFRKEGTEMIITKKGRRVFPVPSYVLCGLNPNKLYDVILEIHAVDNTMHKFSNGEWVVSKEGSHMYPTPAPGRSTYLHPFSPNTGLHWMREPISFSGMKISNNLDAMGTIVLQSMRKYMMSLIISELNGSMTVKIALPETTFVAVTQYQNEKVTQMKIDYNPFANGFRFTANKSRDKTKRLSSQDAESEDENKPSDVSSSSPLELKKTLILSNQSKPDIKSPDSARLMAYLEKKRKIYKKLLPAYFDQLKTEPLMEGLSMNTDMGNWPSTFTPSNNAAYPLYDSEDYTGKPIKNHFMFQLGEANPLAQVRQFGELNQCSDMELPLSLVKKKKTEDHVTTKESYSKSPNISCKSPQDSNLSAAFCRYQRKKNHILNDTSCFVQKLFADGQDVENTVAHDHSSKKRDKAVKHSGTQLTGRANNILVSKKSGHDGITHHIQDEVTNAQQVELKENKIRCLPHWPTNTVSCKRSIDNSDPWHLEQGTSKNLRSPEIYNSVNPQTERWLQTLARPEVTLKNGDLWATTHEVVISSEGRPMFPFIFLNVNTLQADHHYHFHLKLVPSSLWIYDYNDHEWIPSIEAACKQKITIHPHPDNPKSGSQWGSHVVFDRLRLSTLKQGKNTLKIQLRRQYLPVVVVESDSHIWEYPLKDATFITVKIDRSPYQLTKSFVNCHTSSPEPERVLSGRTMGSAHRKQNSCKRRSMNTTFDNPDQAWTFMTPPIQSSPLNLKTSEISSMLFAAERHSSPSNRTLSSSSVPSATSTSITLESSKFDKVPNGDHINQHVMGFLASSTSLSNNFLPTVHCGHQVDRTPSSHRKSPASSVIYHQDESETE